MDKVELKNGWLGFLMAQQYTHAVTFKPNPNENRLSLADLHRLFVKVHMVVDSKMLGGSRYLKASKAHLRSPAIGIAEGLPLNGHLHGAFEIAPSNFARFEEQFTDGSSSCSRSNIWRRLMPSGTCVVERIDGAAGWHRYCLKDVWRVADTDKMIFLPLP